MNNLIQVQSLQMQGGAQPGQMPPHMQQQMQQLAGGGGQPPLGGMSGGLGVDMGGMLINSQFNRQQHMQMQMAQQQQFYAAQVMQPGQALPMQVDYGYQADPAAGQPPMGGVPQGQAPVMPPQGQQPM